MHKLPGKRKVSYGAETTAPEAPASLKDVAPDAGLLTPPLPPPLTAPDLAEAILVQDTPPSENPAISDTLAKFNVVRTQLLRSHTRYLVKWQVTLTHEQAGEKLSYYGKVNDISENGLSMFCDYNVFFSGKVKLVMTLPPLNVGMQAQKIEVESKMVYIILSQFSFRIGLEFLNFHAGEKKILMDRLESSNAALRPGNA
ncbi:PilZ domain-containing protein [Undibacterium sp. TC4M20W]|uniref:PilZ domain-containing protein n=1 Tax=Undibacterium sp. TC4M20W TaxID=3413052 RepID=UPI003BF0890F